MNLAERFPTGVAPRAAARMAEIEPFHVMQIIARAKALEAQGRSIVNMVVGEPDFPIGAAGARRGDARARSRPRALHAGPGHHTAARGDLRLVPDALWCAGPGVAHSRDDGFLRSAAPDDGSAARSGRRGAAGRPRLSVQPAFRSRHRRRARGCGRRAADRIPAHRRAGRTALDAAHQGGTRLLAVQSDRDDDLETGAARYPRGRAQRAAVS